MRKAARIRRSGKRFGWMKILALLAFVVASILLARAQAGEGKLPALPPGLEKVRAKLEKYRDPIKAVHDGYFSTLGCVQYPDGAMGAAESGEINRAFGRPSTFQPAEVAAPRALFERILGLIAGLKPLPHPT